MPSHQTIQSVGHSATDMFSLVADVETYPDFVPLCQALMVRSRRQKADRTVLLADMTAGYKSIRETFTSQVILNENERRIDVSYVDGPFKYLENAWRFEPIAGGRCEVHFSIDYAFKNRALELLMGSMFDRAFTKFVSAFEEEADRRFGE